MRRADGPILESLSEAIEWARARWDNQRPVPVRLHQGHTTEGRHTSQGSPVMRGAVAMDAPPGVERLGSPPFTHAFAAALDGSPKATEDRPRTSPCYHPLVGAGETRECPECFGVGFKEVRVDRYRFPMTLALSKLSNALPMRRSYPHPARSIVTLAEHGWDAHATARSLGLGWDMAEAHLLRSLRQLHARYQEGPINAVAWVDKSDAQRNAEGWTAA